MATSDFEATTSADAILAEWWIELEGIRKRYGTGTPSWNPSDVPLDSQWWEFSGSDGCDLVSQAADQVALDITANTDFSWFALMDIDALAVDAECLWKWNAIGRGYYGYHTAANSIVHFQGAGGSSTRTIAGACPTGETILLGGTLGALGGGQYDVKGYRISTTNGTETSSDLAKALGDPTTSTNLYLWGHPGDARNLDGKAYAIGIYHGTELSQTHLENIHSGATHPTEISGLTLLWTGSGAVSSPYDTEYPTDTDYSLTVTGSPGVGQGGGDPDPADVGTSRFIEPYMVSLPRITGQVAEPLNGTTTPHEFEVELLDVDEELTTLFSVHDTGNRNSTEVTVAVTSAATTITVDDATVFTYPCDLYIARETVRATSQAANVITVTRGQYGSEAVAHDLTDAQGNTRVVAITDKPTFMLGREVVLCENRTNLVEADAIKFRGYLEGIEEEVGLYRLRCPGWLKRINGRIGETLARTVLSRDIWGGTWDAADIYDVPVTKAGCLVEDEGNFESAGHVIIDSEIIEYVHTGTTTDGEDALLFVGTAPLDVDDVYIQWEVFENRGKMGEYILAEPYVEVVSTQDRVHNKPYFMAHHRVGAEVRQIIHADDFDATTPESIILEILTSTGAGTNGDYDTLPKGWGLGILEARVDASGIENVCNESAISGVDFYPFAITEPTDAKEWLEENILRPCHLFFVETDEGKISVRRLYSKAEAAAYTTPTSIGENDLLSIPKFKMDKPPMGKFTINMNYHPGEGTFYGILHVIFSDGQTRYQGLARNFDIDCKTLYDPRIGPGSGSFFSAAAGDLPSVIAPYIQTLWSNFATNPPPEITIEVPYNQFIDVQVGQVVKVTSTATPDVKGSDRGISAEYFQVIESHPNPERSSVECICWMIGIHDDDTRLLAPTAKVSGYAAGGGVGGKDRVTLYDTTFADGINYTWDAEAFEAGNQIMIVTADYQAKSGAGVPEDLEINGVNAAVGACWIDLETTPTDAPADGDYITTAKYDDCDSTQTEAWAYLADTNAQLGAANDDAHKRDR